MRNHFISCGTFMPFMAAVVFSACSTTKEDTPLTNAFVEGSTSFKVESVSPLGEIPSDVRFPSIQVQFSEPVVPLAKLGEPSSKSDVVTIEPKLKGTFRWYGTSLLSFDCEDELIPQKKYTLTVHQSVKSIYGTPISGAVQFSFFTEELSLKSIDVGYDKNNSKQRVVNKNDVAPEYARNIVVQFGNKVNANIVSKYLTVEEKESKKAYQFKTQKLDEQRLLLYVTEPLPRDTEICVTLKKGAVPDKQCIETTSDQTLSFHTLRSFAFTGINGTSHVSIFFNHRIKETCKENIVSALHFSDGIHVEKEQVSVQGNTISISDIAVPYNVSYTISLEKNVVEDVFGQVYEKEIAEEIHVPDADSYAAFRDGTFIILESQFEPRRAFEVQNIEPSSYTITPLHGVTSNFVVPEKKTISIETDGERKNRRVIQTVDLSSFLEQTVGGKRGAVKFEGNISYGGDSVAKNQNAHSVSYIQSTDLGVSVHSSWNETAVMVTSMQNGSAVPFANVSLLELSDVNTSSEEVLLGHGTKCASATTDKDGLALLSFSADAGGSKNNVRFIEVRTQDDRVVIPFRGWSNTKYVAATLTDGTIRSLEGEVKASSIQKGQQVVHIFSDRGLYRPGETARIKIIDRTLTLGQYETYTGAYEINFVNNTWSKKRTVYKTENGKTGSFGTASAEWKIPEDLAPGTYYVEYKRSDGSSFSVAEPVHIQFFERLRFQASAELTPVVFLRGDSVTGSVQASYLGGGSLSGGSVHTDWTREASAFVPQGDSLKEYTFGPLLYDWFWHKERESEHFYETEDLLLSSDGTAHISVLSGGETIPGAAYRYNVQANITDAGNQMISSRASSLVHPAAFYIGIRDAQNKRGFAKKGESITFQYVLCTPEGLPVADVQKEVQGKTLSWKLERKEWKEEIILDEYGYESSEWKENIIVEKSGSLALSSQAKDIDSPHSLSICPKEGGQYLLTISAKDAHGRAVVTEKSFYVSGSDSYMRFPGEEAELSLTADKAEYEVGETATLLLESPLPKGRYLFTLEREGILHEEILTLSKNTSLIEVPIQDSYVPVVYASLSSYIPREKEPPRDYDDVENRTAPQSLYATTSIAVSKKTKQFDISIAQDKTYYLPGSEATLVLTARKNGKPVENAELTLMAVDRGVLDLIGYKVQNPLEAFYASHLFSSRTDYLNSYQSVVDPVTFGTYTMSARERALFYNRMYKTMATSAAGANGMVFNDAVDMAMYAREEAAVESEEDGGADSPAVRKDFRATAVFLPSLITDSRGEARAQFTLPDSLTEYVITVVGVKEQNYGFAEESLSVTNPLSVRTVETRILRPGDEGEAGVVITNTSEKSEEVRIDFDVLSGLEKTGYTPALGELVKLPGNAVIVGKKNQTVTVAAGETKTVLFRLSADSDGWITLAFKAKSDSLNEVIYKPLEIEKPYIYESVTTLGHLSEDEQEKEERIIFPLGTEDGRATFRVQMDATRLGTLTDAVTYVFRYPYGCLEQRSSAVLPLVAFGEYIDIFGLESEVQDAPSVVQKEIASWAQYQKSDGGFPYWPDARESSFAVSLRIAEILSLCKSHGIEISPSLNVSSLLSYIQAETARLKKEETLSYYALSYAYYVQSLLGAHIDESELKTLMENKHIGVSELSFIGLVLLRQNNKALSETVAQKIKNYISLTTRGASFQTRAPWSVWHFYNSDSERYALSLHFLTLLNKSDSYNAHLVYQLLETQKAYNGYWGSTASTARVLIALEAYIKENNLSQTDFSSEAFLNGTSLLHASFHGLGASPVQKTWRTSGLQNKNVKATDAHYSLQFEELPSDIPFEKEVPLLLKKEGKGNLFYTVNLTYAVPAEEQVARDEGLCVYVEITDARTGEKVKPGALKSGTIYKETVYVTTTKSRTFVAVRAPVPAGAEILNAAFVTTANIPSVAGTAGKRGYMPYYSMSHQDIYDSELRCFWNTLPIGTQSFTFLFRAERSGTYTTPSVQAECMYEPEIFGRSAGAIWNIN